MMDLAKSRSDAALSTLAILQLTMLAALFTQTPPHPPLAVAPFALGPFLGAAISIAVAAIVLGATRTRLGTVASVLAAVVALVSYGPQKWIDPAIGQIWPAVLLGEIAAVSLLVDTVMTRRAQARVDARGLAPDEPTL
jgi:hypothetical protein